MRDLRRVFDKPIGRKLATRAAGGLRRPAFDGKAHDPELSTARWQSVRGTQLATYPLCEVCQREYATEVHHIVPRSEGGDTFDSQNLVSVCGVCHLRLPGSYRRGLLSPETLREIVRKRRAESNGQLLAPADSGIPPQV